MAYDIKKIVGRRVGQARSDAGLTQAQLAEAIDRTEESVSNIERGVTTPPLDKLKDIANTLQCNLDFLIGGLDEQPANPARQKHLEELRFVTEKLSDQQLKIATAQIKAMINVEE